MDSGQKQDRVGEKDNAADEKGHLVYENECKGGDSDLSDSQQEAEANKPIIRTVDGVSVRLLEEELWNMFLKHGNEMIINRRGRRLFPNVILSIEGIRPEVVYSVTMGIVSADQKRYKYVNDKWQVMGNADPGPFRNISLHPDSPSVGKTWSKGNVSFEKIKLTNNKEAHKCVLLNSMHKYKVEVTIKEFCPSSTSSSSERQMKFDFPETTFVAVTAYQSTIITKLKIHNNPFAKAFRDGSSALTKPDSKKRQRDSGNINTDALPSSSASSDLCYQGQGVPFMNKPDEQMINYSVLQIPRAGIHGHLMPSYTNALYGTSGNPDVSFQGQGAPFLTNPDEQMIKLTIPQVPCAGFHGNPVPPYMPWAVHVCNRALGYPFPAFMPMWYPDRMSRSMGLVQHWIQQNSLFDGTPELPTDERDTSPQEASSSDGGYISME